MRQIATPTPLTEAEFRVLLNDLKVTLQFRADTGLVDGARARREVAVGVVRARAKRRSLVNVTKQFLDHLEELQPFATRH